MADSRRIVRTLQGVINAVLAGAVVLETSFERSPATSDENTFSFSITIEQDPDVRERAQLIREIREPESTPTDE